MFGSWLAAGERELGVVGHGFLQGTLLGDVSASRLATATERRIVMLDGAKMGRNGRLKAAGVYFDVAWSNVQGYWTGVLPFPPELWREGPEGEVVVFTLDPVTAGGQDLVICSNTEAWAAAGRAMGVPEIHD
jgi:hypothetical protein